MTMNCQQSDNPTRQARIEHMKFGYTIIYVADVAASLDFFENAIGLKTRFLHESGYGEQ